MNSFALSLEQDIGERFHLHALAGTSESKATGLESLAINEAFNQDFTYDYRASQSRPTFTYGFDLTDPDNWLISELRFLNSSVENNFDTLRADLSWDVNDTFTLTGGLSQKDYEFDLLNVNRNSNLHADDNQGVVNPPAGCNITQQQIAVGPDIGSDYTDWTGQTYFLPNWEPYSAQIGFPPGGSLTDPCFALTPGSSGRRNVQESDTGAYVQVDFRSEIGSREFFGNVGVRYVETEVDSTGDIATVPVTVTRDYTDTLPALNLGLWVTEEVVVRASWAKVMARPALGDLSPGGSVDGFNRRYTAGNPGLEPFRADATDLAVEWYYGDEALVSLAYFRKDIESFPQSVTETVSWQSLGLPDSLLDNSPATPADPFDYTAKQTGPGGDLDGFELQFQTPFNFGPGWVRDFGVKLNYTDISSSVIVGTNSSGGPIFGRLQNQSDTAYNATLWYENENGFAGRVSLSHTGDSPTGAISRFTVPGGIDAGEDITDDADFVDAKLSYQFNESLSFSLDMLNLTDESVHTLMGSNGFLLEDAANAAGRQYYLGVQYSIW
jgi:TonB-dependent receptor